MKLNLEDNAIIRGDNLEWLNWIPDGSIDLCYIDPPYFSGKDHDIVWKNGSELRSFGDKFKGDVRYYIEWMRPRIELIHRKLKSNGSIFLQCDWHASHRLRCLLEDIFGANNFQNEIIWQRTSSANDAKTFGNNHDTILFYSKTNDFKFKKLFLAYDEEYKKRFSYKDSVGYFRDIPLTAKGLKGGGYEYTWKGKEGIWKCPVETMREHEKQDRIYYTRTGTPNLKGYLHESPGKAMQDMWTDISGINSQGKENLGYPTQKPESLISRIIESATEVGDIVLDCFVGGGTTAKVCSTLKRRFIVGDVSPVAVRMTATRLKTSSFSNFAIKNLAKTKSQLLDMDGKEFEKLLCEVRGWEHSGKGGSDGNIDGYTSLKQPVQIKNRKSPAGEPDIREFYATLVAKRQKKGFFVAWDFAKKARGLAAQFKQEHGVEIELMTCEDALESLLLDEDHHMTYEKIFNAVAPAEWTSVKSSDLSTWSEDLSLEKKALSAPKKQKSKAKTAS